jgi:2-oxoisovalerate dehydrogenase E1 component
MDLLAFVSMECPLLLPAALEASRRGLLPEQAREHLREAAAKALATGTEDGARRIHPALTVRQALDRGAEDLGIQVEGYFRREELRRGLDRESRVRVLKAMLLSRELDGLLKRMHAEQTISWEGRPSPQKGFRAWGQEASAALALALRPAADSGDVVSPLIRGLPLTLMVMDDPLHAALVQAGKAGTAMEGRDFHLGDLSRGVLPPAAPLAIGAQTLIGLAYAAQLRGRDSLFLSVMGEGGTSMGEWHEAITFAAARRLPMVFVVENNRWALGTPASEQCAADRFARKAAGYGCPGITIDGNDPDEVAAAALWAGDRARAGKGPALLELATYRRAGHAHHDDDRFHGAGGLRGYEDAGERAVWEAADPIERYERRLREEGVVDEAEIAGFRLEARRRVVEAQRAVEAAPWPSAPATVYAPREDPRPAAVPAERRRMSYDEAIRQGLLEALERDPRVFVIGEDVGGAYGGAFGVTRGLAKRFGEARCLNAPLAESAILGCAVGAALAGLRPVAEIQFADFVACGFNALANNAAKIHARWGRPVPMVVRLPYGAATGDGRRLLGGGPFHSQCPEAWFLRVPGLRIVAPSTPSDAKGLLNAAIRDNNPVLFMEAKGLYGMHRPTLQEEVPLGDFEVPLGVAAVRREGKDVTIVSYGAMVHACQEAAQRLAEEGSSAELIDLRTLQPLDGEAIRRSVAKTHRAIIVHEDSKTGGMGAEIAAFLAEKAIFDLDAPVLRVAAPDAPVPYAPPLEAAHLPGAADVVRAARSLLGR